MINDSLHFEELMQKYFLGKITNEEEQLLSKFLMEDNNIRVRFDEMVKLRAISLTSAIESKKEENYKRLLKKINIEPEKKVVISTIKYNWLRIAAIITLLISVSTTSYFVYNDFTTSNLDKICYKTIAPIGSQTKIILPDSTIVWLNSGSSLEYSQNFDKKNRNVTLTGEGYFEVKKNKRKPFLVSTGSLNIEVTGTTFNVRAYSADNQIEVDLIEGIVSVFMPDNLSKQIMHPNEQLVFNKVTKVMRTTVSDAARSALWTTGKLCFVDANLDEISKDLERKFNVKIKIKSSKIKNEFFSGSLDMNTSLKDILTYLDVDKKFIINQTADTINIDCK